MTAAVTGEVLTQPRDEPAHRPPTGVVTSLAELGVVLGLWGVTLARVDTRAMSDLGLISVLPWTAVAALALMAFSFARALARPTSPGWLLTGYPLTLSTLVFSTPPILYESPRYSWAWKHVGIAEYIDRTGAVDPQIDALSVYHSWPGFFAVNAMLSDLAGFDTSLTYAAWAELFMNLLALAAVIALLRALTTDSRTVAVGGWLFVLGNWVGQGYFSPQGISYVWYLIVVAVVLQWFPGRSPAISPADRDATRRVGLGAVVLLLLVCIASTHQLTPVIMVLTLVALVVFRQTRVWSLPVFLVVVVAAWVLYVAEPAPAPDLGLRVVPNPSTGAVTFRAASDRGEVVVFDVQGRRVAGVSLRAGVGEWDGTVGEGQRAASGVYLAQLQAPGGAQTVSFTRVR